MTYVVREYDPPKRVLLEVKGNAVHALGQAQRTHYDRLHTAQMIR